MLSKKTVNHHKQKPTLLYTDWVTSQKVCQYKSMTLQTRRAESLIIIILQHQISTLPMTTLIQDQVLLIC